MEKNVCQNNTYTMAVEHVMIYHLLSLRAIIVFFQVSFIPG